MVLRTQLALKLLSAERWTDQARRDLVASVLMIVVSGHEVLSAGMEGFNNRSFRMDEKLLSDLHAACSPGLKVALIGTPAFKRLPPPTFKRLFLAVWRDKRLDKAQRNDLAAELPGFIRQNPTEAEDYRGIILELLWSPYRYLCLRGLYLAGFLSALSPRDLERIKRKLTAGWFDHRMNALNGLCELVKRHRELDPAIVESATSDEVRALARRIQRTDPDEGARLCAHYLLKAIREYDLGRKPSPGKPPKRARRPGNRSRAGPPGAGRGRST